VFRFLWRRRIRHVKLPKPGLPGLQRMSVQELTALLSGDQSQAARWVEAAARQGVGAAQVRLGRLLLEGSGLAKDENAAWRWFMTASRDGDVEAMNMVGRCYENGWGVPAEPALAAVWYSKAAERGDAWAQYNLGHLLLDGNGVARDQEAAFSWYCRAAAQGHARAMNLVAICHEHGWGTARDPAQAVSWYRFSAEAGYFRGEFNYATLLLSAGRKRDARIWFQRAAAHGTDNVKARVDVILRCLDRGIILASATRERLAHQVS
jgi:TPR repeat protein